MQKLFILKVNYASKNKEKLRVKRNNLYIIMKILKYKDLKIFTEKLNKNYINYDILIKNIIENKKVLIICGPTCTGKTEIAINLASILKTNIISLDSIQIYKGMNIGTDKYDTEKYGIKQFMVDIINPDQIITVVEFRDLCRLNIEKYFFSKNEIPILVGGSGLYIRGTVDNLEFIPKSNPDIRKLLIRKIKKDGLNTFYKKLEKIDQKYASKISKNDERRIIRALEVYKITGKTFSKFQNNWEKRESIYNSIFIGIDIERSILYRRIENRVDRMFGGNLIEEVRNLKNKGYGKSRSLMQAVGYKEVLGYLEGDKSLEECIFEVKKNTKRLAKKQLTWFKADKRINWIRVNNYDNILYSINDIIKVIWEKSVN